MGRRGQSITLAISERDKVQLENLALELGITWGDRPNISKLVEAIARRKLLIRANYDWTADRINALNQARIALVDAGNIEASMVVAQLLLERSEIALPLRAELDQFVAHPVQPWRLAIEHYIRQSQPFQLSYQDAAEQVWQFTIRYAELTTHEDRQYLDCWCDETTGNQDLPELAHNRCLRLDRITDASVAPVSGQWHGGLATILVEMHLFRGLAFAYRSKTNQDEVNEWLTDSPQVRRVVRRVSSTFWLLREISRYWEDCIILSPQSLRMRMQKKVEAMHRLYDSVQDES
ncbi:WYL domain-containing protein [Leptolyngbya sp. NK1-12]|uniref:WYL domain-containing protein n=1 Tax=Leptolyngbya sp. NK1-12 TaxID=2547451 RepID=A0AA96WZF3_9CYAN|nr:WYL domain-containing protein [Leptolyngbya sp. NK1-12]MBF2050599.1 WYL domain-containing protein [Elainella sp. C42_A2020_010]WNZ27822.1 WYL domain-containing protein [Leptolyngbya sp. NK1-12]